MGFDRAEYMRAWHQKNKVRRREEKNRRRKEAPGIERPGLYRWRKNNREALRLINRKWATGRRLRDPNYRTLLRLRVTVYRVLKGRSKSKAAADLLGCEIPIFLSHVERLFRDGMTWKNYGAKWEIDHRIPVSRFDLSTRSQQLECFNWSNLQPLLKEENREKANRDGKLRVRGF
jgi:hypothetical protein